jgi:antitoxin component of MazEF toxin-antitoxin module
MTYSYCDSSATKSNVPLIPKSPSWRGKSPSERFRTNLIEAFLMLQHLQRQGDRLVLIIEPALAEQAGLTEQSQVEVAVTGNSIVIAPVAAATHLCQDTYPSKPDGDSVLRRLAE